MEPFDEQNLFLEDVYLARLDVAVRAKRKW